MVRAALVLFLSSAVPAAAQPVPEPFPRSSAERPVTTGQAPAPVRPAAQAPAPRTAAPPQVQAPTEAELGIPIYPGAEFITSYDAGQGQRYYLFGALVSFADLVTYYRNILRERGDLVFDAPATHMFEVGRFREESMAFPPSVTIKDYTWGGRGGYLNPKAGAEPARFPTIIQIVPPPAGTPR